MAFADDDDILQDFLVEAGEILEQLSEQLVDLEQKPDDRNLLNAIFRGFHTVKGGAGFLQLDAMVECCHITENLFDILRNGKRGVTSELMDVVLQALDAVNAQFAQISQREEATPASPDLIAQLERLVSCEDLEEPSADEEPSAGTEPSADEEPSADKEPSAGKEPSADEKPSASEEPSANKEPSAGENASAANAHSSPGLDITDDEFENFIDAIADSSSPKQPAAAAQSSSSAGNDITDDEFEDLLDQLHGKGKGPGTTAEQTRESTPTKADATASKAAGAATSPANSTDEISEDEFEALLDQLHGAGKGPGAGTSSHQPAASATGKASPSKATGNTANDDSGLITDDEFENLLDQLHGKGHGPSKNDSERASEVSSTPATAKPAAAKPAPKPAAPTGASKPGKVVDLKENQAAAPAPAAAPAAETTVRVDTQRLDDIMNMVGELVLVRNRLVRLGLDTTDEVLSKAVGNLDVVTADLQTAVMKTRMQPIKKVFGRFPRVVRDLARNLKKEINLELKGEDTDLDKNLVEALADPLVHLVRNAVDHGIELPDQREANGKPRTGKVVLSAEQEGDHILLAISDDGGGMDPKALRAKAVEKGILDADAAARISDTDAFDLIFAPGFSTKTEISDVSGRGVGMDVVKTKITQLNGSIQIQSKLGEGTRLAIKVPLTLAIMPTLMVMLEDQTFALPLVSVNEIFHLNLTETNVVDGQECVTVREKAVPIFHLKRWLIKKKRTGKRLADGQMVVPEADAAPAEGHVVIVTIGTQRVGFVVDQLIGQEEVVIKPLGKMLHGTPGMAGATITGDGTIALILDVPSLLQRYAGRS